MMGRKRMWKSGVFALMCAGVLGGCGNTDQPAERISGVTVVRQGSEAASDGSEALTDGAVSGGMGSPDAEKNAGEQGGGFSGNEGMQADGAQGADVLTDGAVSGGVGSPDAEKNAGEQGGGSSGNGGMQADGTQKADVKSGAGNQDGGSKLSGTDARRAAYQAVLEKIYTENVFPDGNVYGIPEGRAEDMSDNRFAVYDIDSDGKEELIIEYTTTITAGMSEWIFDYDSTADRVTESFREFPALTFFDNGVIIAKWSHNQALSVEFWPYTLYRYDKGTDAYVEMGRAEAWEKARAEKDYDGSPFPKEVDVDGDGVVYYITEGAVRPDVPVDGAEYESWLQSYVGGAKELAVPFLNLTKENIAGVSGAAGGIDLSKGQIKEQSFEVELDGWGKVTFASFEPEFQMKKDERGQVCFGDARFALLKDGRAVYTLPGVAIDNVWYGQQFGQVVSAAFRDYNEDGRKDILLLLEYAGVQGPNIDVPFREARAYTQVEGGKEFVLDELVTEDLCRSGSTDSMEAVYQELENYSKGYAAATSKSVWEVERYARKVRDMILAGDYQGLSGEISYPVTVDDIVYRDKEAFLTAPFVQRTNPKALEELEAETCRLMSASWRGIMLGNGCVWIGEILNEDMTSQGLKVIGLNGLSVESVVTAQLQ